LFLFYFFSIALTKFIFNSNYILFDSVCPDLRNITLFSTPDNILECFGGADIASYVKGAYALDKYGLHAFSSKGFGTWPPGFSFVELLIIKSNFLNLVLGLLLLSSILWAFVFLGYFKLVKTYLNGNGFYFAVFAPIALLMTPIVNQFFLWRGVLMSESISTAFFLIGILAVWRNFKGTETAKLNKIFLISVTFAIAAYLRAQFDLVVHSILILGLISILLIIYFYPKYKRNLLAKLKFLLFIFIGFQLLILPYKFFMYKHDHGYAMANVSYIFESVWKDDIWLNNHGASFFVDGGGNSMCHIRPDICENLNNRSDSGEKIKNNEYKKTTFFVVLTDPLSLANYKLPYFWQAWLDDGLEVKNNFSKLFNSMLFCLIILSVVIKFLFRKFDAVVESFLLLSVFSGATIFCWIVHFESRYLFPVKLIALMIFLVSTTTLIHYFYRRLNLIVEK